MKKTYPDAKSIMRTVSAEKYAEYKEIHKDNKYFQTSLIKWLNKGVKFCHMMKLHKSPPLNILDIGTGGGWLPKVMSYYGHNVVCTDVDKVWDRDEYDATIRAFEDMAELLGVTRTIWETKAFVPAPSFGVKFDLVTAINVDFAQYNTKEVWREDAWDWFFEDMKQHMNNDAKFWFVLNKKRYFAPKYDVDLISYFESIGEFNPPHLTVKI